MVKVVCFWDRRKTVKVSDLLETLPPPYGSRVAIIRDRLEGKIYPPIRLRTVIRVRKLYSDYCLEIRKSKRDVRNLSQ